jgi:hypothetical protein
MIGAGLIVIAAAHPAPAQTRSSVDARVVGGVTLQGGIFGDDSPKDSSRVGLTIGVQTRWRAERRTGPVLEVAFQPLATRNPHFDESLRVLTIHVAPEIGRTFYLRAGGGVALHVWSGRSAERGLSLGPSVGLAVGRAFIVGDGWRIRPEFAARASVEHGALGWTLAGQVPIGMVRPRAP